LNFPKGNYNKGEYEMARTPVINGNKAVAVMLRKIEADESSVSRFHKVQLLEAGYLVTKKVVTDAIKAATRGRHKLVYEPSAKGRTILSLSKSWKMAA
jgi:hypothetical protein